MLTAGLAPSRLLIVLGRLPHARDGCCVLPRQLIGARQAVFAEVARSNHCFFCVRARQKSRYLVGLRGNCHWNAGQHAIRGQHVCSVNCGTSLILSEADEFGGRGVSQRQSHVRSAYDGLQTFITNSLAVSSEVDVQCCYCTVHKKCLDQHWISCNRELKWNTGGWITMV